MANQHVVPKQGHWQVKAANSGRATKNIYAHATRESKKSSVRFLDRKKS